MTARHRALLAALCGILVPAAAAGAQVTVRGRVVDSLSADGAQVRPLAGAVVQIVAEDGARHVAHSVTSDSSGAFLLTGLPPGRYLAGFFHPRLDSIGVRAPGRRFEVRDRDVRIVVAVPSAATIGRAVCLADTSDAAGSAADSAGLLLGRVRSASDGRPSADARVSLSWWELVIDDAGLRQGRRAVETSTDSSGRFAICDLPLDSGLRLHAERDGAASGELELRLPGSGFLHRELFLAAAITASLPATDSLATVDPAAAPARTVAVLTGTARLAGTALREDGSPLAGARVHIARTGMVDTTTASGAFELSGLPAGTHMLEARALGYLPQRVIVDLHAELTDSVRVRFDRPVQTLERVSVYAGATRERDLTGFSARRERGMGGRFLTAADLAHRQAASVADALRTLPGVKIVTVDLFTSAILVRNCTPTVYLDGMYVRNGATDISDIITPGELGGIEVYTVSSAPAEFLPLKEGCGVIVLWSKGALPPRE